MQFRCILCEREFFKVNLHENIVFSKCDVFYVQNCIDLYSKQFLSKV